MRIYQLITTLMRDKLKNKYLAKLEVACDQKTVPPYQNKSTKSHELKVKTKCEMKLRIEGERTKDNDNQDDENDQQHTDGTETPFVCKSANKRQRPNNKIKKRIHGISPQKSIEAEVEVEKIDNALKSG